MNSAALLVEVRSACVRIAPETNPASDSRGVVAPWLSGAFFVAGLSSLALPGTNSFVSEFLVLIGTFTTYKWFAIVATVGIIFAALYIPTRRRRWRRS